MKPHLIYILLGLIFPIVAHSQTPPDVCRVTTHTWSLNDKVGTGSYELGEFQPIAFEDKTLKYFKHDQSGLTVSVGMEYGDFRAAQKGKPTEIKVALAVSNKEQNALSSVDGIVAGALYRKRWGLVYAEKQVAAGDLIYTFKIACNGGRFKRKKTF